MNTIISKNIRVRHPDSFEIGEGSIVDDYSYFSTRVSVGVYSHIAASCTVGGGCDYLFSLGDFSSLSSGVRVWCTSNDFARDLVMITPEGLELPDAHVISGDVTIGNYTGVGANTVIMPAVTVPEGTVIGAQSMVPASMKLDAWSVYAGIPVRKIRERDRDNVMRQVDSLKKQLSLSR